MRSLSVMVDTAMNQNFSFGAMVVPSNDFFIGNHRSESKIYEFVYGIIPNFQFLWPADYITQGFVFTPDFIYLTAIYTAGFVAGFLALAVGLFQTREVG